MQEIREVQGSSRFKDFETKRRNLVINSLTDRKPMQALKERGCMVKFGTAEDKSSSMVQFNSIQFNKSLSSQEIHLWSQK